jgi:hypothetical protein
MATTIKSTELDFDQIKNSLKLFLAQTDEFGDYNFEASGMSNILDVLAYNTHYNSLLANFALNESFLSTAQLRSSLVSLAGGLGYTVRSKTASCGIITFYVTNPLIPASMTLPAGFRFSSTINNKTYTFKSRQTLIATNNGSNQYYFQLGENQNFAIYEGKQTRKVFIAGPAGENVSYVIPTESLDLNTVKVNVYADTSTTFYDVYTNLNDTVNIDKNSRIFVIKEAPNGQFELSFGNGARLGKFPSTGNKIEVIYDEVAGPSANGGRTFTPLDTVLDGNGEALTANVTTIVGSLAGQNKESIESIRKNAPYLYATQNRMVTAQDYASLVLRKYSNLITDIKSWGGEDNLPPRYGSVYLSIVFNTLDTEIQSAAKSGIQALAKNLSVASFNVQFTDPTTTYLEVQTTFQWNPNLTTESQTAIETLVNTTVENYFNEQLGGFDKSFRRSNLLTVIDDAEPSILSSRADVKMQYRFIPVAGTVNYTIDFPAGIADPDNTTFIVRSDNFYIGQKVCYIRNRLNTKIIEVIDISTGSPLIDNIGEYNGTTGQITLSNFTGVLIAGTPYIKITAIPANQATINASRSDVLAFDNFASSTNAIITDTV